MTIVDPDGVETTVLALAGALRTAPGFAIGAAYVDLARLEEAGVPVAGPG